MLALGASGSPDPERDLKMAIALMETVLFCVSESDVNPPPAWGAAMCVGIPLAEPRRRFR